MCGGVRLSNAYSDRIEGVSTRVRLVTGRASPIGEEAHRARTCSCLWRLTWTKFGSEFYPKLRKRRLSVDAALTHSEALAYLYTVEQWDCTFEKDLLPAVAMSPKRYDAADELIRCGLWRDLGECFEVVDHANVLRESLAAQNKKLDRDRRSQAAKRSRQKAPVSDDVSDDRGDDVSGDADRQPDSPSGEGSNHVPEQGSEPWPEVTRPPLDL